MSHKVTLFFLLLLASICGYASHLRTGEISYVPVPGQPRTYDITVTLYLNNSVGSDQIWIYVLPGDNSPMLQVLRSNGMGQNLPGLKTNKSIYTFRHIYPKDGKYIISTALDIRNYGRNTGIVNIPNSLNYRMYLSAMLTIDSSFPPISSPFLSFPPIDNGCINKTYKINPGAIDLDQDLLRFQLLRCQTANDLINPVGIDIPGYQYPNELDPSGRTLFTMDSLTGIITWDKPTMIGEYNIAFKIMKYRNGVMIGYVIRDMQVTIAPCPNNPPVIDHVPDICIQAGTPLTYKINSKDPDNDTLTFLSTGGPYDVAVSPATYTPQGTTIGSTTGIFNWNTIPIHFTKNPYQVYYKVTDKHFGSSLSDVTSNFITLIAPPVKNVNATVLQNGFNVKWDQTVCTQSTGYNIYRKIGSSNIIFDSCTLGVPGNSGFALIGTVNNQATPVYTDLNNGTGFDPGYNYCYIVTVKFADGVESAPSEPYCSTFVNGVANKGIAMPNAFEPENPHIELNTFRPMAIGLQTYFLGVWDLWGNLIWSSEKLANTQPAEGWDGTDRKGNKLPSQHYIWRMKATFIDGLVWEGVKDRFGKLHKEGTFFLLR